MEQLDIFDSSDLYLVTIYHHAGSTTVIREQKEVTVLELQDILKDWNYHENVLDSTIYNSKNIERRFMIVAPLEETKNGRTDIRSISKRSSNR